MIELNKIHLGDSYELIKEIPDKSIDCIYVDVPYLHEKGGAGTSELAKRACKQKMELLGKKKMYDKEKSNRENLRIAMNKQRNSVDFEDISNGFNYELFIEEAFRIMKKPNMFIWCSAMQILDLMNEIKKYTDSTITILTWNKTNPIPTVNNLWLSDIEYCLYVREGIRLNDGYELKSKWYVSGANVSDKEEFGHPTIKPLDLVKRHILHTTQENDVVLDCFSGSGTTCIACKELGRQFIGIEIDPNYHKISVDRLNGINVKGQTSIFTDFENIGKL